MVAKTLYAKVKFSFYFYLQYNAKDTSPLSIFIMHPFWNYIVNVSSESILYGRIIDLTGFFLQFFPPWIAPNTMTFVGFLFTVLNFVLLSWYDWNFWASSGNPQTTPIPNAIWALAAINIFLAYTLGKQIKPLNDHLYKHHKVESNKIFLQST